MLIAHQRQISIGRIETRFAYPQRICNVAVNNGSAQYAYVCVLSTVILV